MHDFTLLNFTLFVDHTRDDQESPFPHLGMALERNFGPGAGIRTSQSSNIKIPGAYPRRGEWGGGVFNSNWSAQNYECRLLCNSLTVSRSRKVIANKLNMTVVFTRRRNIETTSSSGTHRRTLRFNYVELRSRIYHGQQVRSELNAEQKGFTNLLTLKTQGIKILITHLTRNPAAMTTTTLQTRSEWTDRIW